MRYNCASISLISPTDHRKVGMQDAGAGEDREGGDDRCGQRTESHQRQRALIGLVLLGDDQGAEEDGDAEQRADGDQDDPQVEVRGGLHRHIGGEHHARLALEDGDVGHDAADDHQPETEPGDLRRCQPAAEQRR
jgi:hypothetical protein